MILLCYCLKHNGTGHLKIMLLALCPSQIPQTALGPNPGFHSETLVPNCLSHGMGSLTHILGLSSATAGAAKQRKC